MLSNDMSGYYKATVIRQTLAGARQVDNCEKSRHPDIHDGDCISIF